MDTNNTLDAAGAHEGGDNETVAHAIKDGEQERTPGVLSNISPTEPSSPPASSFNGRGRGDTTGIAKTEDKDSQGYSAEAALTIPPVPQSQELTTAASTQPRTQEKDYKRLGGPGFERANPNDKSSAAATFSQIAVGSTIDFLNYFDAAGPDVITVNRSRKYESTFPQDRQPPPQERPRNLCHACRNISLEGMRSNRVKTIQWAKRLGGRTNLDITKGTMHKNYHLIWESSGWCELCYLIVHQAYYEKEVEDCHEMWEVILSTFDDEREIRIRVESPWERRTGYLSLYCLEDSPLRNTMRGRKLSTNPFTIENLQGAKDWLQNCARDHRDCDPLINAKRYGMSLAINDRPYRLIEITQGQGNSEGDITNMTARLIDNTGPLKREFVALSYMWGRPDIFKSEIRDSEEGPFRTTSSNITDNYISIPLDNLERRIREALTVTLVLGFQYIWIDALCIVQDHEGDKASEIQKMHHIYGLAALTIVIPRGPGAPIGGDSCIPNRNTGFEFLGKIPPYPNGIPFYNKSDDYLSDNTPWLSDQENYYIGPPTQDHFLSGDERPSFGAWNDRGWTLQERCLSNRAIVLGPSRILLICRVSSLREKGQGDWKDVTKFLNRTPSSPGPKYLGKSSFFLPQAPNLPDWFYMVEDLSARDFTDRGDKADAILGMGLRLRSYWQASYVRDSGLFWLPTTPSIAAQLLWCSSPRIRSFPTTTSTKQETPFSRKRRKQPQHPTWSWLSQDSSAVSWRWIMSAAGIPSVTVLGAAREFLNFHLFPADHVPLYTAVLCKDRRRLLVFGQMVRVYVSLMMRNRGTSSGSGSGEEDWRAKIQKVERKRNSLVAKGADLHELGEVHRLLEKEEEEEMEEKRQGENSGKANTVGLENKEEKEKEEEEEEEKIFGMAVFDGGDTVKLADTEIFALNVLVEKYGEVPKDSGRQLPAEELSYVLLVRRMYHSEPLFRRVGVGIILDKEFFKGKGVSCITVV